MPHSRLIIVANRLPFKISRVEQGVKVAHASGGLVSAVLSYMEGKKQDGNVKNVWVGYPECSNSAWKAARKELAGSEFVNVPVFIPKPMYNGYYNGLSNSTLWPLFHYFPSFTEYNPDDFAHYVEVNRMFCEAVKSVAQPGDTIWIHDYHLMLLPEMLREALGPDASIGFFLHIPFPSFEIFRLLPSVWREGILRGILGADQIGFHTRDYATYFTNSVRKILGLVKMGTLIRNDQRISNVNYYPISIDFQKFNEAYLAPEVIEQRGQINALSGDRKLIFSVDRLDYTKGLMDRLRGFRLFLETNPGYLEKVVFVLNVVPSRDVISKYSERKRMIDEFVGTLNSDFGHINWQPVIYQYRSLDFHQLMAFYTVCNVALITPLRDGMNLVAKEFVASRKDLKGVLILSEMTGSSIELSDALLINPTDVEQLAHQIGVALEMPEAEQEERMKDMQEKIRNYDVKQWAADFLSDLSDIKTRQNSFKTKFLTTDSRWKMLHQYHATTDRLFILDYDGTLAPFEKNPEDAFPKAELLKLLENLSNDSRNQVFIVSGRKGEQLEAWLGHLNLNLAGEHGARFKLKATDSWSSAPVMDENVRAKALKIMNKTTSRCPSSFVEEKEYSLVWHCRNAAPELGGIRSRELFDELNEAFANTGYRAFDGNKIVELKSVNIHKGQIVKDILSRKDYDFIFCVGDDFTDEDMFLALHHTPAWTINVGYQNSFSKWSLPRQSDVIDLLQNFIKTEN